MNNEKYDCSVSGVSARLPSLGRDCRKLYPERYNVIRPKDS